MRRAAICGALWLLAAPGWAAAAGAAPSELQLTLDGQATTLAVTAPTPARAGPAAAVVLVHGFTRTRATMAGHAARLAADGWWALAPELPYTWSSLDNARVLRELVAALRRGALGVPVERVVLVGFSAGGLAALLAADAPGVVGYVGLDPFDRPNEVGLEAARRLQVPALLLRGPASFCNAYSIAAPWATALPRLVADRQLPGASHCDFEDPTDRTCRLACGRTDAARQRAVRDFLRVAVARLLAAPGSSAAAGDRAQ